MYTTDSTSSTSLYPEIEPYQTGRLVVSDIHELYFELSGNCNGKPVVFFHGGPGVGCFPGDRKFFNPHKYKIILFDQRGSGKSTPSACLDENTTWDIVQDIERLREHLGIEKWHVFGGSWGSTLALAYAQSHADRVVTMVLRGIFTFRNVEISYLYETVTPVLFPDQWKLFIEHIPEAERNDVISAYHTRLNSSDEETKIAAAKAWATYEVTASSLRPDPEALRKAKDAKFAYMFARIENHYIINKGWLCEGQLLEKLEIDKIRHIPTIVVQGRYDAVCPIAIAYTLKTVWPELELRIVPDAGHSSGEPGTSKQLVEATDYFADM